MLRVVTHATVQASTYKCAKYTNRLMTSINVKSLNKCKLGVSENKNKVQSQSRLYLEISK